MTDIAIEQAPAEAGAKPKKKKGGRKKKLILLLLVVLLGGAGGYYAMYGLPGSHGGEAAAEHADEPQLVVREGVSEAAASRARTAARTGRPPMSSGRAAGLRISSNEVRSAPSKASRSPSSLRATFLRRLWRIRSVVSTPTSAVSNRVSSSSSTSSSIWPVGSRFAKS